MTRPLPRIAYLGEVPVRALSAGSAVLYRLFENYPADRLLLLEDACLPIPPTAPQLNGVQTIHYHFLRERWLRTRWRDWFGAWFYLRAGRPAAQLADQVAAFGAQAIVGIAHGHSWWTAAELARRLNLPFHLIAHDEWRGTMPLHPALRACAEQRFGRCYRAAASRLVVSPGMNETYAERYGATGTLFYPIRSSRLQPPSTLPRKQRGAFTFAFAGDAGTPWARSMLAAFANALAAHSARLRIHYTIERALLVNAGLQHDNVDIVPFTTDYAALQRAIVAGADALYLPMSFMAGDRQNVTLCFPSKTTDYTATGLPLLIQAPDYASAVRWARSRIDTAAVVTTQNTTELSVAVARLIGDSSHRTQLAANAQQAGEQDFSPTEVFRLFSERLQSGLHAR